MALSEEEQKLLDQMEAALAAEDPRLANALRGNRRRWHHRRVVISVLAFAVGVAALVGGMEVHPAVSVLGFVVMLAATVVGLTAWREPAVGAESPAGERGNGGRPPSDHLGRFDDRRRWGEEDS